MIWPVPVDDILCYIASMSRKALASSTIANHLSALGRHHKINSWSDPTENFLVRKCMQGYRNTAALVSTPDARHPITIDMLKRLPSALQAICMSGYEACLFAAMFNLAFFAFLRIGEIAFVTKINQDRTLKLADVGIIAQAVHVKICFSKNDQHGKRTTLIIPPKSDATICPVRSLSAYLSLRSTQPGQFFIHLNGKAVTRYQFSAVLRKALQFLNFHTQNYNTHSFRIGAATYAATQGIQHELLCTWGRWKSAAYVSTFASICCNNSFLTEIWLVGSSLIYWAHRRAVARPVGLDLGLQKYGLSLTWYGSRGMKWKSLLPFLQQKLRRSPPPAWLLLHFGGNDLGDVPTTVLLQMVSRDLTKIHHMMPFTQVIWSDVLQRVTWRGIPDGRVMERKRKRFNRFGRKGVLDLGGRVLEHNEINIADRGLFRQDGVHLSDIGNDIFVDSLQEGLELFAGLSSSRHSFQN
ncbi:uncharacterized protein LOC124119225 [Haliotis rufescens]|uniref:uncharacterized protein LOC124119225 n=1 Tax=Haliotis rufescens TaxID=6454 RepID=UPI00201F381F|nr:uncharacterized protein LOC124119225 [Haliotis rufescens]